MVVLTGQADASLDNGRVPGAHEERALDLATTAAAGMAAFAAAQGWGVLNYFTLPAGLAVLVSVHAGGLVDFSAYIPARAAHLVTPGASSQRPSMSSWLSIVI